VNGVALKPKRPAAIVVNLGGDAGLCDPTAGVFVDGQRLEGVTRIQLNADVETGQRTIRVDLRPGGPVTVVGNVEAVHVDTAALALDDNWRDWFQDPRSRDGGG
jgi:hypothetical protein